MARTLTAVVAAARTLIESAWATPPGTYPASDTYPGSDVYPGRGSTLSAAQTTPKTLTEVSA